MIPSLQAVERIASSWKQPVSWGNAELARLSRSLMEISLANSGRVFEDVPLSRRTHEWHFRRTVETAIARAMRLRAKALGPAVETPYRTVARDPAEAPEPALSSVLEWRRPAPRIDINRATARTLAAIEGMDLELAAKITRHRRDHGPFPDLASLPEIVGKDAARRLAYNAYAGSRHEAWSGLSRHRRHFVRFPTFGNHLKCLIQERQLEGREDAIKATIFDELSQVMGSLTDSSDPRFHSRRVIAASEVIRRQKTESFGRRQRRRAARNVAGATLLDGRQYLSFVTAALAAAEETIRIVMFFMMRAEPGATHPTDRLFDELSRAAERGVDVRVILDKDNEGDVFQSRRINRNAYRWFVDRKIPVVFSSVNRVTHSKIVLVDGRHVISGSHNWTAGSFFLYDDKSLYVDSHELAAAAQKSFDRLWNRAKRESRVRDTELTDHFPDLEPLLGLGVASVDDFLYRTRTEARRLDLHERTKVPQERIAAVRAHLLARDIQSRYRAGRDRLPRQIRSLEEAADRIGMRSTVYSEALGEGGRGRTVFQLLDADGAPGPLPASLPAGECGQVSVCVENREEKPHRYRVRIADPEAGQREYVVDLPPGGRDRRPCEFRAPSEPGAVRWVDLSLHKEAEPGVLYGALRLVVVST